MNRRSEIPTVDTEQMKEVDRLMIEEYGITLLQMMENAGRNLAEQARRMLAPGKLEDSQIVLFCGAGNNGGGGLVAARHLHNRGAQISIVLTSPPENLKEAPAHQWNILQKMGLGHQTEMELSQSDLIVDAMIGYGLSGDPRPPVSDRIEAVNQSRRPVLSLDAPSGLNTSTGKPGTPCVQAKATLTLALPKTGLLTKQAQSVVGELFLADISVPPDLYHRLGIVISPIFSEDSIVQLT